MSVHGMLNSLDLKILMWEERGKYKSDMCTYC